MKDKWLRILNSPPKNVEREVKRPQTIYGTTNATNKTQIAGW